VHLASGAHAAQDALNLRRFGFLRFKRIFKCHADSYSKIFVIGGAG